MREDDAKAKSGQSPENDGDGVRKAISFRIRSFADLRRFRSKYMKALHGYLGFDSSDNPRPDEGEIDFGLERSSPDEAWEFFRQSMEKDDGDDELTEFLHDR